MPAPKTKAQAAIEARDAARARLYGLNGEYTAIERRITELHAQGSAKDQKSKAEAYLDGVDVEAGARQKNLNEAHDELRLVGEARNIQRQRVTEAEGAARIAASEERKPEHRRLAGEAIMALIGALVAVERAKAFEKKLDEEDLLSRGVLEPAAWPRLGELDDSTAPWVYYLKSVGAYAGITTGAMREAFAEFWPQAKRALQIDDAPALTRAKAAIAALTAA